MSERLDAPSGEADPGRERDELDDGSRREMLAKIGRLAYAAPALMLLTEPKRAQAGYGGGGSRPGYGYGDTNHSHTGPGG
jgi:hypothetical protein